MRYCLLLFVCVAFASCSQSTTANGPFVQQAFTPAHVGSTFEFDSWTVNSPGDTTAKDGSFLVRVVETGARYFGKNNVMHLSLDDTTRTFAYVNYEANGNISLRYRYDMTWTEMPVATRLTQTYSTLDSSVTGELTKSESSYAYAGEEDVTLAGHSFHTVKIIEQDSSWTNGIPNPYGTQTTYWFAPEIGWYVKFYSVTFDTLNRNGYLVEISNYTKK